MSLSIFRDVQRIYQKKVQKIQRTIIVLEKICFERLLIAFLGNQSEICPEGFPISSVLNSLIVR